VAIGKRLTDPVKVVSWSCDTAIDRAATPEWDYRTTRDMALVKALPGQALTVFTLRPLPGDRVAHARSYASPIAERIAFALACVGCSDPDALGPEAWDGDGAARHLRDDALATLPDQCWMELGRVAIELGELTTGGKQRFVPPAGLRVIRTRVSGTTAPSVDSNGTPANHDE
jgi:hypothetical protein